MTGLELPLAGTLQPVANRTRPAPRMTDSERDELADAFDPTRLQVGLTYRANGVESSKLTPQLCTVVGVTATGYRTEGPKQVAPVIRFGCEHHWMEVLA